MSGLLVTAVLASSSRAKIVAWQRKLDLPNPVAEDKLHVTIVYSKQAVPKWKSAPSINEVATITGYGYFHACLVLMLDCPYLVRRHIATSKMGATYDYDTYRPHITLFKSIYQVDLDTLRMPNFASIVLIKEEQRDI